VTAEGGSLTFPHDLRRKGKVLSAMLEDILCLSVNVKLNNRKPEWQDLLSSGSRM
jgi:hypothetical protein